MSDREMLEASTEMPKSTAKISANNVVKQTENSSFRILDASQQSSNYLSVTGTLRSSRGLDRRSQLFDRPRSKSPAVTRQAHGIGNEGSLSNTQTIIHLIKATIGTGVLAMPSASRDAGLLLGPLGIFIVGMLVVHAMHLLVKTAQFLRRYFDISDELCDLDYAETVRRTLRYSHWNFRQRFGWITSFLQFSLLFSQFGFLSVYLLFISENTKFMVDYYQPSFGQPVIIYELITFLLVMPLVFTKTLSRLAIFCGLANFLAFFSLILSGIYFVLNLEPVENFKLTKTFDTIPMFFGVIIFAFESINIVMPLENKMSHRSALPGIGGVLSVSMVTSVCIFTAVAFYGYLGLGENVGGSFTYSIPMDPWYFMIVRPMYTISIYISFGLQFYILTVLLWELLEPRLKITNAKRRFWADTIIRLASMLLVFIFSAVVPHVDLMISLIGAFSGSSITLLYPALCHSVIIWGERYRLPHWRLVLFKNGFIFAVGILGAIVGTYTSIVAIIKAFQ